MQTLLLSFNALLLVMVLVALVKGSRVAYLTGLLQGFTNGRTEGYRDGLQMRMAGTAGPRMEKAGAFPAGGTWN